MMVLRGCDEVSHRFAEVEFQGKIAEALEAGMKFLGDRPQPTTARRSNMATFSPAAAR